MGASSKVKSQEQIPEVFRLARLRDVDVFELSVSELHKLYLASTFTVTDYVRFCLQRIHALDPYLEAVIETNPDALEIAAALDDELVQQKCRGQLHGVPVLVKDNMATKDKMQTTAGSWALLGSIVPRDAFVVKKLREAGAVIIGHANMSEWASTRTRNYSDGYSPRGGQCRNPYDLRRDPSGSSGGSAIGVSANYVPLALGTETDSSIAGPAQYNGVVGIKPTPGLVSRAGVIPATETWDTTGTFARSVLDAAIALGAIGGNNPRDALTYTAPSNEADYSQFLASKDALKGARFGLPMKGVWEHVPHGVREVALKLLDGIRSCGGEVIEVDYPCAEARIPRNGKWNWEHGKTTEQEFTVIKNEAYTSINAYLAELEGTPIRTLEDVVDYNRRNPGTEGGKPGVHPAFESGQDILDDIVAHKGVKDATYHSALQYLTHTAREQGIDAALKHTLPTGETVELDALLVCDRKLTAQQVAAQAGYPTITIPIGTDRNGMPVGLTLQQTAWEEGKLIKWGSAIEDLRDSLGIPRPIPSFQYHTSKVLPIKGIDEFQ